MAKSAYEYIKESIRKNLRTNMIDMRKSDAIVKVDKPTDIGRARILGYKDKKGFVIARVRLMRGGRKASRDKKGRRSKRITNRLVLKMNYRWVAEQRAARKFPNLEVLNSYQLAKDGIYYFFEVILVDPNRPEICKDKNINWICRLTNKNRAFRGLTSAGIKSRGLNKKARESKIRTSVRSSNRIGK